ncbi:diguanylate cyclase domain-containing protein [Agarivorans sp.]|uniref:diguanylate cyclase domain-containing protein n=1 Tax=Agarivorans sp. TaxID=1872412 RepID=UPI003D072AC3
MTHFSNFFRLILLLIGLMHNAHADDYSGQQQIYLAEDQQVLPHRYNDIKNWLTKLQNVDSVALNGGSYWLVKKIDISHPQEWIASVDGPAIENIDYYLYSEGNQIRHLSSGYLHPYEYLFSYARHIDTPSLGGYWLITRVSSHFYTEQPQLNFGPKPRMSQLYHWRASIITFCLGAVLVLAIYNAAIGFVQQDRVFAYFSAYVFAIVIALASIFHIGSDLFGIKNPKLYMLPVLFIPLCSLLFYSRFLDLQQVSLSLWRANRLVMLLSIIAMPIIVIWINWTVVIVYTICLLWVALSFVCAIYSFKKTAIQGRLFVLSTLILLVPTSLLASSFVPKSTSLILAADLSVVLCAIANTLLMSLALNYKFKQISIRSAQVAEQLHQERDAARSDALTGLQNRYAFNEYVGKIPFEKAPYLCLALIDIDYLKTINDQAGHQEGDKLIKLVADALTLVFNHQVQLFRIGGDEFAVFSQELSRQQVDEKLAIADRIIQLNGTAQSGISFGSATTDDCQDAEQLFYKADMTMYQQKAQRKQKSKPLSNIQLA